MVHIRQLGIENEPGLTRLKDQIARGDSTFEDSTSEDSTSENSTFEAGASGVSTASRGLKSPEPGRFPPSP